MCLLRFQKADMAQSSAADPFVMRARGTERCVHAFERLIVWRSGLDGTVGVRLTLSPEADGCMQATAVPITPIPLLIKVADH